MQYYIQFVTFDEQTLCIVSSRFSKLVDVFKASTLDDIPEKFAFGSLSLLPLGIDQQTFLELSRFIRKPHYNK